MGGKMGVRWGGRLVLALLILNWGVTAAPARADEPAKELTEEERGRLEKEAADVNQQAIDLYGQGRLEPAIELLKRNLALRRRLYPADRFPDGHVLLAQSLTNLGAALGEQGEFDEAEPLLLDGVAMWRKLRPADKFPDGDPNVAEALSHLGQMYVGRRDFAKAEAAYAEAADTWRRLHPDEKFPDGAGVRLQSLHNLAVVRVNMGHVREAESCFRDELAIRRKLYPEDKYPDGHPDLAANLLNVGVVLDKQGDDRQAERFFRDALAMCRRLYTPEKYPNGHPDLASSLGNLGLLWQARGDDARAEPFFRDALQVYRRLYPADKFPDGHRDLAKCLYNLGSALEGQGEFDQAERFIQDALEMRERLYPPERYPRGHPDLVASLGCMGLVRLRGGDYAKAEPYYRDALEMARKVYAADRFPDGHVELARCLTNLGGLLQREGDYEHAEPLVREGLAMYRKLYPPDKFPDGHTDLANCITNLGAVLDGRGDAAHAEALYREGLEMRRKLYPPDKFPDGSRDLAWSLNNVGHALAGRAEYTQAEPLLREGLAMYRKLYPADRYPDGQPDLARCVKDLTWVLLDRGDDKHAEPLLREALEMYRRLYPTDKYPDGQPDVAECLQAMGHLMFLRHDYDKAEPFLRDSLDMRRRLYPADQYPDGHPELVAGVADLAVLYQLRRDLPRAERQLREALAMERKLYPADRYPDGHPELAAILGQLALLLLERGEYRESAEAGTEGAAMYHRLTVAFAENGAEAEALNLAVSLPEVRSPLLAASRHAPDAKPADDYRVFWPTKAALAQVVSRRRLLLRAAAVADEKTRAKLAELAAAREDLSRLIVAPAGGADRDRRLQDLTDRKERLEKELAAVLPPSDREAPPYADLADRTPDHAAFIDLYRYEDWDLNTKELDDLHYAVFILVKGRPVRRIDLDDGQTIEKDLKEWRQDIDRGFSGEAAGRLRKGVWEPIAAALGENVDTVYVSPDGPLGGLPWGALPGASPGRVLLEDYAFAVVPSGPFLREQLSRPTPADGDAGVLLAVGGVRYDRAGAAADKAGKPWPDLPATDRERNAVAAQARRLARPPEIVARSGADADAARLLADLPRARSAHLATHGFFAAADTQERAHLFRPEDFASGANALGEYVRVGAAARNPLTQSGLVLAGANQPTEKDAGLLTGEAIASLDLDGMDLAVLSACRTGLGEQLNGEGVFGLQRAFHVAGARNVIASLWAVDDESAAALMNLFYYHLWEKDEPPLEALHHAQLELYRNPQGVPALARGRGAADWDETVQSVTKPPADPRSAPKRPTAVKDWAAFVLSGAGR